MLNVEVLVVGAGPAGATAALNLAPTRRVAIVDIRSEPRPRIGESLPPAAKRLLTDMGLFDSFVAEGHRPCYGKVSVWGSAVPTVTDFMRDPDGHGWLLDRARFESWLRWLASLRGAQLLIPGRLETVERIGDRWSVLLTTEAGSVTLTTDFLIDAGGRSAAVARRLGAHRRVEDDLLCGWAYGQVERAGRWEGFSYVEAVEDGWWYTAPLPGRRRVLAFHTDADLPAVRWAKRGTVSNEGAALLKHIPPGSELASSLSESGFSPEDRVEVTTAASVALEPCAGAAWLAAGDAALSFDPLSAQGLLNALFTGLAAAETADGYLSGRDDAVSEYTRLLNGIREAYRAHLTAWYRLETRWPKSPFWQRRQCG
ncbi:MAG TPA: tryptophan 7-halogenase [Chloroflexota bacterium]|nr:tryptophan 7-halogenase [Chloroflexota bacterium]